MKKSEWKAAAVEWKAAEVKAEQRLRTLEAKVSKLSEELEVIRRDWRVLWALEMHDGFPAKAHRILSIEFTQDGRPITYATACHQFMEASVTGCWSGAEGTLPLQAHAIHCDGQVTVSGPSGLPGPVASGRAAMTHPGEAT